MGLELNYQDCKKMNNMAVVSRVPASNNAHHFHPLNTNEYISSTVVITNLSFVSGITFPSSDTFLIKIR